MECAYCGKELVLPWRDPESVAWIGPDATLAFCDQDHYEKYAEREGGAMSSCPHYLELSITQDNTFPEGFECDLPLDHKGKHRNETGGVAVGPKPRGGKARRNVAVTIKWDQ